MRVLGLDLGGHLGWAIGEYTEGRPVEWIEFGCKDLKHKRTEVVSDAELRFRMWEFVIVKSMASNIDAIGIEDVNPATMRGNRQRVLHYGYRGIAELASKIAGVKIVYAPVGTIKKLVTGNGRAEKASMVAAVQKLGVATNNDNAADAVGVALVAINMLRKGTSDATDNRDSGKGRKRKVNSSKRAGTAPKLPKAPVRRSTKANVVRAGRAVGKPVGNAEPKRLPASAVREYLRSPNGTAPWD